ncbi:MAG TPA: 50S ribosomal protein L22 [Candidatus Paceibacterota bacterium]|nr:50S ribosomal protein L22 [Candidatus Paceibacterota bacterium]HMP19194.1 50S ribosomal protein L22 [Candidatus Paceibacterota bacterium]HMP85275.1 50S ribosomal protein L22 [Candidatus Paceibacterota bacterium]
MIKAELKNYRQSPRKVRFVADAIRGKKIKEAKDILSVITKRSALPLKKLLDSAIANAKHNFNIDSENLYIKELRVDSGITMHRMMPRARGSAFAIKKRSSHVLLVLDQKKVNNKK